MNYNYLYRLLCNHFTMLALRLVRFCDQKECTNKFVDWNQLDFCETTVDLQAPKKQGFF
jgi:hypothetical protein